MDVVIVGCGKAGSLHHQAYLKVREGGGTAFSMYLVDTRGEATWTDRRVYRSTQELLAEIPLDPQTTIIDLCLPCASLYHSLLEHRDLGFTQFAVEKPFVFPQLPRAQIREALSGLKLLSVRNYLYSRVTRKIQALVQQHSLRARLVITEFSKDRREESVRGRGGAQGVQFPTIWEIEIPHQIQVLEHLFGPITGCVFKKAYDLDYRGTRLTKHAEGQLVATGAAGALYLISSSLRDELTRRSIYVVCDGGLVLRGGYFPVCEEQPNKNAFVALCRGDEVLEQEVFEHDDNMFEMLRSFYETFTTAESPAFEDVDALIRFSDLINSLRFGADSVSHPQAVTSPAAAKTPELVSALVTKLKPAIPTLLMSEA